MFFSDEILNWYSHKHRDLPWKEDNNAYKIWVSEIILQQTRVEQGLSYFLRFINRFPNLNTLANANEQEVLVVWQGLGYYSRARNMHRCAQLLVKSYNGIFPSDFETLKQLPGIGNYTAAAIASFAFNQHVPAIDGNAYRVLSRFFGIDLPIDKAQGKQYFFDLAYDLIQSCDAASFNQAIMDFGSLICTPSAHCTDCPLQSACYAFNHECVAKFPVKTAKTQIKNRYLYYLHIQNKDHLYLKQREGSDIWKGLYEFPLIELPEAIDPREIAGHPLFKHWFTNQSFTIERISPLYVHKLSHQHLYVYFIALALDRPSQALESDYVCVLREDTPNYPLSRLTQKYLDSQDE